MTKDITVKIKYTKDTVEVDGEEMSIDEWVYSTLNSNGNYDGVGIEDIEVVFSHNSEEESK